jgi:hypothetical protein
MSTHQDNVKPEISTKRLVDIVHLHLWISTQICNAFAWCLVCDFWPDGVNVTGVLGQLLNMFEGLATCEKIQC